jgi:hypothetical protein
MTLGDGAPDDGEDFEVGYGRPPMTTRFAKGRSGNPACRPRGRHREAPYEAILGQMVTVREGGTSRRVTAAEAVLLQLTKRALEGDGAAARAALAMIEEARKRHSEHRCHRQGNSISRERYICAGAAADGQETRSLPEDCTDGPRAMAR